MRHTNGGFLTSQRAPSLGAGCVPGIRERTCTSQRQILAVAPRRAQPRGRRTGALSTASTAMAVHWGGCVAASWMTCLGGSSRYVVAGTPRGSGAVPTRCWLWAAQTRVPGRQQRWRGRGIAYLSPLQLRHAPGGWPAKFQSGHLALEHCIYCTLHIAQSKQALLTYHQMLPVCWSETRDAKRRGESNKSARSSDIRG